MIFNYFRNKSKTRITWYVEVKKYLAEINGENRTMEDRNKFRRKIDRFQISRKKLKKG